MELIAAIVILVIVLASTKTRRSVVRRNSPYASYDEFVAAEEAARDRRWKEEDRVRFDAWHAEMKRLRQTSHGHAFDGYDRRCKRCSMCEKEYIYSLRPFSHDGKECPGSDLQLPETTA